MAGDAGRPRRHHQRARRPGRSRGSAQPGPGRSQGQAAITLDDATNTVCYQLTYEGISKPTAAHIHTGAKGVAGPVAVNLDIPKNGDKGCVPADATVLASIRDDPAGHYVNIHTAEFPKGAMRGQLTKV